MRRIALLLFVLMLAGCKSTVGPLASRQRDSRPDPLYNSEQQQRWARERYPYYEGNAGNAELSPNTFNERYGPTGR